MEQYFARISQSTRNNLWKLIWVKKHDFFNTILAPRHFKKTNQDPIAPCAAYDNSTLHLGPLHKQQLLFRCHAARPCSQSNPFPRTPHPKAFASPLGLERILPVQSHSSPSAPRLKDYEPARSELENAHDLHPIQSQESKSPNASQFQDTLPSATHRPEHSSQHDDTLQSTQHDTSELKHYVFCERNDSPFLTI